MYIHYSRRLHLSNRQRYGSLAVAFILLIAGLSIGGYALASQKSPPQPQSSSIPKQHVPAKPKNPPNQSKAPAPSTHTLGYARPVSLSVPSIGISATMATVGKQANGAAAIPKGAHVDQPAWYKYSPAPGEYGASVILGHVDTIKSGPSVFFNLGKMKKGQKISIKRADGKTAVFTVTDVRSYPKTSFPTNEVYSAKQNGAELRLITCGGAYNKQAHHYTTNVVVYAYLTGVRPKA